MSTPASQPDGRDSASLLDRLDSWLESDSGALPGDVAEVLRGPWDHLAHLSSAPKSVRDLELRRIQNAGRAEDRVRSDYRGRYAIELLQNAHDASADADRIGQAW